MKFVISSSCGKDSALALYRMIQEGHEPVGFITTVNNSDGRSWFHGVDEDLLGVVASHTNIPLIPCRCEPKDYATSLVKALIKARDLGAEGCVFGDIDIDDHKKWNEARCEEAGLSCILPLWGESREALVRESLALGFKSIIKVIDCKYLDESFLGCTLDEALLERIKAKGSDLCGENGEYHTFVYDGPTFKSSISLRLGEVVDLKTHKVLVLQKT